MGTFRCNPTLLALVVFSLACVAPGNAPEASTGSAQIDKIDRVKIEHVVPRPDFVGPLPTRLEWTAAAGVDNYTVSVENEIEIPVFDQDGVTTTSVPWPTEVRIEPGTYYWRITGMKGDRLIADSGRAAFVVHEP
jgi:hypothetical protein